MNLRAFALRADYEGAEGEIAVDGATFKVGQHLKAGKGTIVVDATDDTLVAVLEAYPPLKETSPPKAAKPISPYGRLTTDRLRHLGSLYGIDRAASLNRDALEGALLNVRYASQDGDQAAVDEATDNPEEAAEPAASTTTKKKGDGS